jgi:hypothetical protein
VTAVSAAALAQACCFKLLTRTKQCLNVVQSGKPFTMQSG